MMGVLDAAVKGVVIGIALFFVGWLIEKAREAWRERER